MGLPDFGQETGWGQVYMAAYKDADGDWLDGATDYQLHIPPDPPAEAFWSITLYDVTTQAGPHRRGPCPNSLNPGETPRRQRDRRSKERRSAFEGVGLEVGRDVASGVENAPDVEVVLVG